jgi:chromosome segregation ATPase
MLNIRSVKGKKATMAKTKVAKHKPNHSGVQEELKAETGSITITGGTTADNSNNSSSSASASSSTSHLEQNRKGKLQKQSGSTEAQNEALSSQLSFSQQAQFRLEDKVSQIKRYLIQLEEDKQLLVEECQKADLELQQLLHTNREKQLKTAARKVQLQEEQIYQQHTNEMLEVENQRLRTESNRLLEVKRTTLERNEGLTEDITVLEEIAQTLEQHAHELQATAELLRQRNRLLRSHNKELP